MAAAQDNISTRELRAFVALVQTGSFTAAAERLNITQSAVSKRVSELEQKLAVRLYDRSTRSLELTPEGDAFATSAAALLNQLEQSIGQLQSLSQGTSGHLKLCAASNMSSQIIAPVLATYIRENPLVQVQLHDCQTRKEIFDHIANGTADVGVIGGLIDQDHGLPGEFTLSRISMVREHMVVCFAHGHPLGASETVSWDDLAPYPHIGVRSKFGLGHVTGSLQRYTSPVREGSLEVTMINTAVSLVAADVGIAVFPSYVVSSERPAIAWREIRETSHEYVFSFVHLKGREINGAARRFSQHFIHRLDQTHGTIGRAVQSKP